MTGPARKKHEAYERLALSHFKKVDPVLYAAALPHKGLIARKISPKTRRGHLFASLAGSIVSQQLSTKAADTIWERVRLAVGGRVTAAAILATPAPSLRGAGLSEAKTKAIRSLATAVENDGLDLLKLRSATYEEALAKLTALPGIGPWTVEMFLIFALGNPDIFSPGDLALVRAMEKLYGLPKGTPRPQLLEISAQWAPFRSFASLVLWIVYEGV